MVRVNNEGLKDLKVSIPVSDISEYVLSLFAGTFRHGTR